MTAQIDLALSPLLDARTALADLIATDTGTPCHYTRPQGIVTPCYVLQGAGWVTTNTHGPIYQVTVTALKGDQSGDLADAVEEMARLAYVVCVDNGWRVTDVDPPGSVTLDNHNYAGCQFTALAPVTIREI